MKDTQKMGVPGSPWKMYVDPKQDVICYHNFKTEEKIFEYQMTDEKLMEISRSNYFGEAWYEADGVARLKKEEDWEVHTCLLCPLTRPLTYSPSNSLTHPLTSYSPTHLLTH